jgi:hypothetical protein
MDHGVVGGIELDPLDIRERQFIEGSPGFPVVAREPEARAGRILGQGHVNPDVVFRVEIAAENLWPFNTWKTPDQQQRQLPNERESSAMPETS